MSHIRSISIKNVRCFKGEQELKIRPITFLIGENSTGKTSALCSIHNILKLLTINRNHPTSEPGTLNFNEYPYSMGSYNEIVRKSNNKNEEFEFSISFDDSTIKKLLVKCKESNDGNIPIISKVIYYFDDGEIIITQKSSKVKKIKITKRLQSNKVIFTITLPTFFSSNILNNLEFTALELIFQMNGKKSKTAKDFNEYLRSKVGKDEDYLHIEIGYFLMGYHGNPPFSFAPTRSKPKRTYDTANVFEDPEGSDMPYLLMRLKNNYKQEWKKLKSKIIEFGKSSGLFEDFDVIKLANIKNSPFQIQVKSRGVKSNLIDVGYGINQILPFLIRIISAKSDNVFLLQQPEIHLHPRGQAEFVSLISKYIKNGRNSTFIIETHGDALIKRARIEIMKNRISKDDVSIIYFEPNKTHVKVHNISVDYLGNLENVPTNYRKFFLDEVNDLLGIKS